MNSKSRKKSLLNAIQIILVNIDEKKQLTEERYHLLCSAVRGNPDCSNDVDEFTRTNLSYLYENSCQTRPKFTFDEDSKILYRMCRSENKSLCLVSEQRQ